jgi:hypothetical protein
VRLPTGQRALPSTLTHCIAHREGDIVQHGGTFVRGFPIAMSIPWAVGCAAQAAQSVQPPSPPVAAPASALDATHAPSTTAWPPRAESLLAQSGDRLVWRAFGSSGLGAFEHVIASDVHELLYDAELELLWFSDTSNRLWVSDLRALAASTPTNAPPNVLIASDLPEHQKLSVWIGDRLVEGSGQLGEGSVELSLRWDEVATFETDAAETDAAEHLGRIEGKAWLQRERERTARAVPELQKPDESGPHIALPAGIAQCDNPELCGAARPFGSSGWQLVITKTDETHGDFSHYGCLLHDRARAAFARPPDTRTWHPAADPELDTCGPYRFNARGDAFLASDRVCRVGAECTPLGGVAIGWLEPGATVGRE